MTLSELSRKEIEHGNIAEALVETLVAAGVKRVYGVAGDSLNGMTETIRKHKSNDFRELFTEDNNLYLLSFLLTANCEEAERCFVAGLADCVDGNPVFKVW